MKHRTGSRPDRGQSLTELAIAMPVLLIILAGVLDLGRLYYVHVAVTDAAAEGAIYAAYNPPESEADETLIIDRVQAASRGLVQLGDSAIVTIDCPTCPHVSPGDSITITAVHTFSLGTPFITLIVPSGVLQLETSASEVVIAGEF
jgi:hypothetical protein